MATDNKHHFMIQLENVQLSFDGKVILKDLSFHVEKGRNVCVSGPSGIGKSSILRMLQGYIIPDAGHILVGGVLLTKDTVKDIRSEMAYVPQNINLPVYSGVELMALLLLESRTELIEHYIEELGLEKEMTQRSFDEISGGEKQRIIISVCLSLGRKILLLDEPTSSLDDESIGRIIKVIRNLSDVTVVSASHNPEWIRAMDYSIDL